MPEWQDFWQLLLWGMELTAVKFIPRLQNCSVEGTILQWLEEASMECAYVCVTGGPAQ